MRIRTKQVAYRASPEHKSQLAEIAEWWTAAGNEGDPKFSQADVLHSLVNEAHAFIVEQKREAIEE